MSSHEPMTNMDRYAVLIGLRIKVSIGAEVRTINSSDFQILFNGIRSHRNKEDICRDLKVHSWTSRVIDRMLGKLKEKGLIRYVASSKTWVITQ